MVLKFLRNDGILIMGDPAYAKFIRDAPEESEELILRGKLWKKYSGTAILLRNTSPRKIFRRASAHWILKI